MVCLSFIMYSCHAIRKENSNYMKKALLVVFFPNKIGTGFASLDLLKDAF